MRILHVIATLDPAAGGPPLVAASLAVAQARCEVKVGLLAYASAGTTANVLSQLPVNAPVDVDLVSSRGRIGRLSGSDARPLCRRLVASADFVHLHGVWEPILLQTARACRRAGVPYALSPHGMLDPWSLRQSPLKKKLALRLGYRRMVNEAAFIHCLNDDERDLLQPLGLNCAVEVIPNGIFPEQFHDAAPAGALQQVVPQLQGRPYILFLARLHYKKGLDYLADAFAQVAQHDSSTQLVVAGPDGGERDNFERRIRALDIGSRVHLPGPVYGPAKHALLKHAALFCLPSRQEGFSMAITEALACGTPCVVSDACHFPQVQACGAGQVVALTAAAIATALTEILDAPSLRDSMSQAAIRLSADYLWPQIARRLLDAYRTYLPEAGSRSSTALHERSEAS